MITNIVWYNTTRNFYNERIAYTYDQCEEDGLIDSKSIFIFRLHGYWLYLHLNPNNTLSYSLKNFYIIFCTLYLI